MREITISKIWDFVAKGVYSLDLPVDIPNFRNLKVLDVGSGYNPRLIADVMVNNFDIFEGKRTVKVLGRYYTADIEHLPFRDKAFDLAIAHHVFEHVRQPDVAFREITRVAETALIITPSALREARGTDADHYWFVFGEEGRFVFDAIPPGFKDNPELRRNRLEKFSIKQNDLAIGDETVWYRQSNADTEIIITGTFDAQRYEANQRRFQEQSYGSDISRTRLKNRFVFSLKSMLRKCIHVTRPTLDPATHMLKGDDPKKTFPKR